MPYCVYLSKSFVAGYTLDDGVRVYVTGVDSNKAVFANAEAALVAACNKATQVSSNAVIKYAFTHRRYTIVHQSDWSRKGPDGWEGPYRDFPETTTVKVP